MKNNVFHQIDETIIPLVFQMILDYIEASTDDFLASYERVYKAAHLLYDISPALYLPVLGNDFETDLTPELNYEDTPFELVPFSYNGGDALNYSWVNLAPELDMDDYPCVSFAPGENGALWLGDPTAQALTNLLVGQYRGWKKWENRDDIFPYETEQWHELVKIIGIEPDLKSRLTAGARSDRRINPSIPNGWHYEMTPDGIGVLAEKKLFSGDFALFKKDLKPNDYIQAAVKEIRENHPASALVVLKYGRSICPDSIDLIQLFLPVYESMGREAHVNRVKIWLERDHV